MENDNPRHTNPMEPSSLLFPLTFSFPFSSCVTLFSVVFPSSIVPSKFLIFLSFLSLHICFWAQMVPNLQSFYLIRPINQIFATNNLLVIHPSLLYLPFSQRITRNKSNILHIPRVQIHNVFSFYKYWPFLLTIDLRISEWCKWAYLRYEILWFDELIKSLVTSSSV